MVINVLTTINGQEVRDIYNLRVNKSIGENNISSSFNLPIPNEAGINNNKFEVGQEVIIYSDKDAIPTTVIFRGILEDISYAGTGYKEKIELSGRDYTARLMDRTVEPEIYSNLLAGSIVKDIIFKYTNNISFSGVELSSTTIPKIRFNHTPVYDAIKQLADLSNYTFYVDVNKDLHFESKSTVSSGYTFSSGNVISADFKEQRDTVFNQIWVYGDRYLDSYTETLKAGSPLGGSIFTLEYNPNNTQITVAGSIVQPGAIAQMSLIVGSNIKYLVNYDNKTITFTSGTLQGNNVPTSGAAVIIQYDRLLPIVKVGEHEISKSTYGTRVKVIQDTSIKDPLTAEQLLLNELDKYSLPAIQGTLNINGVASVIPGQTCVVNLPNNNIVNKTYDILSADYNFNKENMLTDNVLTIKVNKKLNDITDTMKDILNSLRKIQGGDISSTDLLTRFQTSTGSVGIESDFIRVQSRSIHGNSLILNNSQFGLCNINTCYYSSGNFILGNVSFGILGFTLLGGVLSAYQPYITSWYGSYDEGFTGSDFISGTTNGTITGGSFIF